MKKIKKLFSLLGPGFITGASDDDPSGVVTYSQTGALFGLKQLWTAPFSFPFMYVVQEMCGRIGMVTGKGLAGVIKNHYKPWVLYLSVALLFFANVVNISADLSAMAATLSFVVGLPFFFWLITITLATLILEIFVSYKVYARYLKYLAFTLLFYVGSVFFIRFDIKEVIFSTIIPYIEPSRDFIVNIVAVLGTTISPYIFFWQSYEEVEEEVEHHKLRSIGVGVPRIGKVDIARLKLDTAVGMFFSNLIMWFIVLVAGTTLFQAGIKDINTPQEAAQALRPIAGNFAFLLFSAGIIGTGLLAVPILAGSASYALSEALGFKVGLSNKLKKAHGFYGAITIAMFSGFLINFVGIPPMRALYYTAVLNGLVAPILLFVILSIANDKKIMGNRVNDRITNILGLTIALIMSISALLLIALSFLKN